MMSLPTHRGLTALSIIVTAVTLSGCQSMADLFIGKLPPPDPLWSAVVQTALKKKNMSDADSQTSSASQTQAEATRRAREYLAHGFPMSSRDFLEKLKNAGFKCDVGAYRTGNNCRYMTVRPPEPCTRSIRVIVEVTFDRQQERVMANEDFDVSAMAIQDDDIIDNRGCFPL